MDWNKRERPICLEKRFEFKNYSFTRDFLDRLGNFCEKIGRYPDISFGKTYANLTIRPEDAVSIEKPYQDDETFALAIDSLYKVEE